MNSVDQVFDIIKEMKAGEIVQLVDKMKEEWGVSGFAAAPAVGGQAADDASSDTGAAPVVKKFDVVLESGGSKKVEVIKMVRKYKPDLALMDAKTFVEKAGEVVKAGVAADEAEEMKKAFEASGAVVKLVAV